MSAMASNAPPFGPLVSIIISSFNYGRFLGACIDSALEQTYRPVEVIVVDDGSSDESPSIVCSYGSRIRAILKENGGQASALNTGFRASAGQFVCFVDSDDLLHPQAIERACNLLLESQAVKVHWPLIVIDDQGHETGAVMELNTLDEGERSCVAKSSSNTCEFIIAASFKMNE